jgi:GT2 family glycosyltransferase
MLSVDEAHHLRASLPAAVAQPGAHVLVVDNASTDATAAVIAEHGAERLALPERRSYAAAMNAGFARCEGDAVLVLNADCIIDAAFLDAALPRLQEPGVGSVAPKLLRMTERGERLDEIDAAGMVVDRRRKNTLVGHGAPADAYDAPGDAFGPDGACALYRRETLEQCSADGEVLDEDMALWASDVDLAWRARLLGWRCVYEPRALGWHIRTYSPSTRAEVPEASRRLQFRNRLLMMRKNDRARDLLRDLPWVLVYEILALGHVLLRERHLLGGYRDAWRLRAGARARAADVRARRSVGRVPFGLEPPR